MPWRVDFYQAEDGSRPLADFLDALPLRDRAKLDQRIHLLREFGPLLDDPYSSQGAGDLPPEIRTK